MNIFKNLIIYGIGAATGAFVAIKLLEDHYAAIADEEIEAVKKMAREKIKEIEAKYEKDSAEVKEVIKKNEEVVNNVYKKVVRDYSKPSISEVLDNAKMDEAEKTEYPREDDDMDELEEEMYEKEAESDKLNERLDVEPYLITEEEFSNEKLHYDKETLWYYLEDKVLCYDDEGLVDDPNELIGDETLDFIEDNQTIYIRNDSMGSDFEIICLKKSYQVEVLGGAFAEGVREGIEEDN